MMEKPVYLPFYMTYPVRYPYNQENRAARDIEYLREMYPAEAKRLLGRISEILDRMDYEESMIYDEYPDRWQLYRLAESIVRILQNEAMQNGEEITQEKWEWISDMVQVLLFDEIFNRRHGNNRGRRRSQIFVDREDWGIPYGNRGPNMPGGMPGGMTGSGMGGQGMPGSMTGSGMGGQSMPGGMNRSGMGNQSMPGNMTDMESNQSELQ